MIRKRFIQITLACLSAIACARPPALPARQDGIGEEELVTVRFHTCDGGTTRSTGIDDASEQAMGRWAVFAFDQTNNWFRYACSPEGDSLSLRLKLGGVYRCYALVNYSTSGLGAFRPETVRAESDLTGNVALLADNEPGKLMMFGSVLFSPLNDSEQVIQVTRLVSRIQIKNVAVDFSAKPYLAAKTFTLRHIYITNVYRTSRYGDDYGYGELSGTRSAWYNSGGWHRGEDGVSRLDALLGDRNIDAVISAGHPYRTLHVFYAFPNPTVRDNDDHQMELWTRRCTRIVLEATLGEDTVYYQVDVPDMQRNHVYTARDIVIRGRGSNDPEVIDIDPDQMDIVITWDDGWDNPDEPETEL